METHQLPITIESFFTVADEVSMLGSNSNLSPEFKMECFSMRSVMNELAGPLMRRSDIKQMKGIIGDRRVLNAYSSNVFTSYVLAHGDIDVVSVDSESREDSIGVAPVEAVRDNKDCSVLFMSCIPYDCGPWASDVIKTFAAIHPDGIIIIHGEGKDGCCADDMFFATLEALSAEETSIETVNWPNENNVIYVYQLNNS